MKTAVMLLGLTFLLGCSDAEMASISALGKKHTVKLYACDGHIIQQWQTSGKVENEANSNGYYFNDDATGKLIMVDGTVVIEVEK